MRNLPITILAIGLSLNLWAQADNWSSVVTDGFGISFQTTVPEMEVFRDTLYIATSPEMPPGSPNILRSSTGDAPWENVTPSLPGGTFSIHSFGKTDLDGGHFWFGTGNPVVGCAIYHSTDGSNWNQINYDGFGSQGLAGAAPNMIVFQDPSDSINYLYAGAGSHGGPTKGEVWRIPYDSENPDDWQKLIDFDTVATTVDDTVDQITYFEIWNDKIYFGTNGKAQLWESTDGINFTQNMGVGYGFGDTNNLVVSAMEIFNDTMYVTTTNMSGGQLWSSGDGITFSPITTDAFGEGPAVNELRKPIVAHYNLWLTGYTNIGLSTGVPVWRYDGVSWMQSNDNGFGDTLNNGQNASLVGFQNYVYAGVPNYNTGGQIWRTDRGVGIEDENSEGCLTVVYPNPVASTGTLQIETPCQDIDHIIIYDNSGRVVFDEHTSSQVINIGNESLPPGTYSVHLYHKGIFFSAKKIIIK